MTNIYSVEGKNFLKGVFLLIIFCYLVIIIDKTKTSLIFAYFTFFASLWTEPQARSINLQKKNETNIFKVRSEQANPIKFLLSWLYFEFPEGTARLIGETRVLL